MNQTNFKLENRTLTGVEVYLTLGAVKGCVTDISQIHFIKHIINPSQGWFILGPSESVSYLPPQGMGFNGNFAFGTPPLNCPTNEYPYGINIAEFMLNNSFQSEGQETIDISCVAGVNAFLEFSMNGGGNWNAGPNFPNVLHFKNSHINHNTGRVGVYPYLCDECTQSVNPPNCGSPIAPINPQLSPICNVQRPASPASGGTVNLNFLGFVAKK